MGEKAVTVNPYSLSSFYCVQYSDSTPVGSATCFLTKQDDQYYLVTNWHVATGRNPDSGALISSTGVLPNALHVFFPRETDEGVDFGSYQKIPLFDVDGNPQWREKKVGRRYLDVVVIPVTLNSMFTPYCIEDSEEPFNENPLVEITSSLYVLGFPFGRQWGALPIWKKASIASEPEYEAEEGFPYFFVDSASRSGMSGSPVVLFERRPITILEEKQGIMSHHFTKLIGVYSGRIGVNDVGDVQLGRVWKASVINELIKG